MSFGMVVSVGSLEIHEVWSDEGRLPHETGVTRGSRGFSTGWRVLRLLRHLRALCFPEGVVDVGRIAPPRRLVSSSVGTSGVSAISALLLGVVIMARPRD